MVVKGTLAAAAAASTIGSVNQRITATLADDTAAQRLMVQVASPLLKVQRAFFDTAERCCYYVEVLYPASRFEYRMTLVRGKDDRFRFDGA